ncbi:hypothetical protein KSP39_PZI015621 [Platanthera zijinensis]|uniref:Uncharacterized protein n=1 Tax=Platanthera zijinensis TaxID=2320716 RepID=A0AAP0G121_9ASPA
MQIQMIENYANSHGRLLRRRPVAYYSSCLAARILDRVGDMPTASATPNELQSSGMLSREQLLHLFSRFSFLASQPDVKKRIVDAVRDKQEAVAITTAIQDEILLEMGIDPRFGIACLGKVNAVYENDMDLMIQFYRFIAKEEMAIDEAELEPYEFADKMDLQQRLQEQQLEMLKNMRRFHLDNQSKILEKIHEQMLRSNFANNSVLLTSDQIQEIVSERAPISRT